MARWLVAILAGSLMLIAVSTAVAQESVASAETAEAAGRPPAETTRPVRPTLAAFTLVPVNLWVNRLAMAPPAPLRRPRLLTPLYLSFIGLQAGDLYTTTVGLRQGAQERNALIGALGGGGTVALKVLSTAGTIFAAERLWPHHPVRALVLMAAVNGALAAVAIHNGSVLNRYR